MRDILIDLSKFDKNKTYSENIIREGENKASRLLITLSDEFVGYLYKLKLRLNDTIPILTDDLVAVDNVITYELTNVTTFEIGTLKVEIQAYDINNALIKSAVISLCVRESVSGISIETPNEYALYVRIVEHYMDNEVYDPSFVFGDAFNMDNMKDGSVKVAMLRSERDNIVTMLAEIETLKAQVEALQQLIV